MDDSSAADTLTPTGASPRPRGKHRLPPRLAMQAEAEPADTPEVAEPAEPPEPKDFAEPAEPADPPEPEDSPEVAEAGEPEETPAAVVGEDDASEPQRAERKPATKRLMIAVIAAAAVFVGTAAFAAAMLLPYLRDRALVDTKLDVARTAANAITTLWTYTPDDMDKLADRSAKYLSGDFESDYRRYVDAIAPTNKQAQVSNSTQVLGAAVESLDGPNATAVVYTNSTYTSPVTKNVPSLRYLSYRLTMQRKDARWQITKMTTITSVDLSPKLG